MPCSSNSNVAYAVKLFSHPCRSGGKLAPVLTRILVLGALLPAAFGAGAQEASPIVILPTVQLTGGQRTLLLRFHVPAGNHIYADRLSVEVAAQPAKVDWPAPVMALDSHSGTKRGMYVKDFTASVPLASKAGNVAFAVNLQACDETECYFPETRQWVIHPDQTVVALDQPAATEMAAAGAAPLAAGFQITQRATGYLGRKAFLSFLDKGTGGAGAAGGATAFAGMGVLAVISLILLGGLALNLTPCVLPMIPINLAILGAGANGGNRRRGVALGGAYGLGMALAYGGLGLVVVLTGSKFGALQSSPWFNFAIAAVFVVLGLAMFDKIAIDLSRFQRGGPRGTGNVAVVGAALLGAVSALLAGACVAPVVISVLLLATTSYQHGQPTGLAYPFVLGLGMALPWPFAAGGLSFLPKPGMWMTRVKYAFGVAIFAFAIWYGWLGWSLVRPGASLEASADGGKQSVQALRTALAASRQTGKPVLVDFWASWCKNCEAMRHTTLEDQVVRRRLKDFQVVPFEAEHLDDATIKPVLDEFGVLGLPTFVVLRPEATTEAIRHTQRGS